MTHFDSKMTLNDPDWPEIYPKKAKTERKKQNGLEWPKETQN